MFLLVTHAIFIIMIMENCIHCHHAVLYYVIISRLVTCKKCTQVFCCSTPLPYQVPGHLMSCWVSTCYACWFHARYICHWIPLAHSVLRTTENTPNIIQTRCKNNAFVGSVAGDRGGFSANQSKPWRHAKNSYTVAPCQKKSARICDVKWELFPQVQSSELSRYDGHMQLHF